MNRRRLKKWQRRLPEVVDEFMKMTAFDMGVFQQEGEYSGLQGLEKWPDSLKCCTAACAAGFLPPIFPRARKKIPGNWTKFVMGFFNLYEEEADYIIEPNSYIGVSRAIKIRPLEVCVHMQEVLSGRFRGKDYGKEEQTEGG